MKLMSNKKTDEIMSTTEDFLKRADEILQTAYCWNGIEDEVLKLYCLFTRCATFKHDCQELVNVNYVREKLFNLLIQRPNILSDDAAKMFCSMKIEKELGETALKGKINE